MKRFRIFAIAAIAIGMFSAFNLESRGSAKLAGQSMGFVFWQDEFCFNVPLDNINQLGCDKNYTGPICTAYGYPAYANLASCEENYTPGLLKRP